MDFRNCPICFKLFKFNGINMCSDCISQREKQYQTVRNYIREHPQATAFEVSQGTNIATKVINSMIEEGSLFVVKRD